MKNLHPNRFSKTGRHIGRNFTLDKMKEWLDFSLKFVSILAILSGGVWAIYNFHIADTLASSVQMAVELQVTEYSEQSSTLFVRVKSKNVGKVPIEAGKEGLQITIRRLPVDLKDGYVSPEKAKIVYSGKIDLIKEYGSDTLEPGVEQQDMATFIVQKGCTYIIEAQYDLDAEGKDPTMDNAFAVIKVE